MKGKITKMKDTLEELNSISELEEERIKSLNLKIDSKRLYSLKCKEKKNEKKIMKRFRKIWETKIYQKGRGKMEGKQK